MLEYLDWLLCIYIHNVVGRLYVHFLHINSFWWLWRWHSVHRNKDISIQQQIMLAVRCLRWYNLLFQNIIVLGYHPENLLLCYKQENKKYSIMGKRLNSDSLFYLWRELSRHEQVDFPSSSCWVSYEIRLLALQLGRIYHSSQFRALSSSTLLIPVDILLSLQTDGNASFLRAARAGNLEKVLEYLKGSIDINTSNAVSCPYLTQCICGI